MIRDVKSKLPDNVATTRTMKYILEKAELVGGSEAKFESTSMKEYAEFGAKKFRQVNNKYQSKNGRHQEVEAVHEIISFHTDDKISPEMVRDLALSVWRNVLDLDNRKYRYAVHTDTDEIHIHLIWNKRNNKGEIYDKKDDYLLFEKLCYETELKHGLKVVENRKFLKPEMPTNPQSSNEYRYERKGVKSEKSKFKDDVLKATDAALTASEFLQLLDLGGYTIIVNAALAYSLEKDGQVFKASDVGASYKSLKGRFGDDSEFPSTLARLGKKTAPKRQMGRLAGPQFTDSTSDELKEAKKNLRQTLYTRFDSDDGKSFRYKNSRYEAFHFSNNTITFNAISPQVLKAGLQKMIEEGNQSIHIQGDSKAFKRETWYQFHLMGLAEKGYKLYGYEPSEYDHLMLEKRKREQNSKFNNGNSLSTVAQKTKAEIEKSKQELRKETQSVKQEIQRTKQEIEKAKYEIERAKIDAKTEEVKEKKEVKSLQTSAMQVGKASKANKMKMNDNSEGSKSDSGVNKEINKAAPSGTGAQKETHSDGEDGLNLICASSPWNLLNVKMAEMEATRGIAESKRRDVEGKEETVKKHLKNKPRPQ
jgi:hypothetical protein